MSISQRLEQLGIELPQVAAPVAAYVPAVTYGNLVQTSGQLPFAAGQLLATGVVRAGDDLAPLQAAARQCALNAIAAAADAAGGVDRLGRVVKVTGFVASHQYFNEQAQVINGASEILQEIFESPHSRSAVGVAALPLDSAVEVEVLFEVK